MIPEKYKNLKVLAILNGTGTGSKLLQSYLDGHSKIITIPGLILMYYYPHWKKITKNNTDISYIIDEFFKLHPSLINTENLPGSDTLNKLGENKNYSIKLDHNEFKKNIISYMSGEEINSKNFFISIHLSYYQTIKFNIENIQIISYHIHTHYFLSDLTKDFKNIYIISMLRELKSNVKKRIFNSFQKPNKFYLNKTDSIILRRISYKNVIYQSFENIDVLKKFKKFPIMAIKHEDFLTRKNEIIIKLCTYLNINSEDILYESTYNKLKWNPEFYNIKKFKNGVSKNITDINKEDYFFYEIFWMDSLNSNYNSKYNYQKKNKSILSLFLTFFAILLPSKMELRLFLLCFNFNYFKKYFRFLTFEINNCSKLKNYKMYAFYNHKWTNKSVPFRFYNFFISYLKSGRLFGKILYFTFKSIQYASQPFFIIIEYFYRVIFTLKILFRLIKDLRYLPEIL